jgi:hypothetical protein
VHLLPLQWWLFYKKKFNKIDLLEIELDDLLWFVFHVVIKSYDPCCGFRMLNLLIQYFFLVSSFID